MQKVKANGKSSAGVRQIKNVEVVYSRKTSASASGRSKTAAVADSLLYLVNFEDDAGFAILAADRRVPQTVLAIMDEGNITAQEFNAEPDVYDSSTDYGYDLLKDFNLYNAEADDYYVAQPARIRYTMTKYVSEYVNRSVGYVGHYELSGGGYTKTEAWYQTAKKYPMLTTRWRQGSPFNDFCPNKRWFSWQDFTRAPAGCVPIAIAQILAYHELPSNTEINGYKIDWKKIKNILNIYNNVDVDNYDRQAIAHYVSFIGQWCGAVYSPEWTFALPSKAKEFLETFVFTNVNLYKDYEEDKIITMLDNSKPVFIAAVSGMANGHAWVIDGYIKNGRDTNKYASNGKVISTSTEYQYLLHCNYGWQGLSNGYYTSEVFDLKTGPVEIEDGYDYDDDDVDDDVKRHYDAMYHIITYDKY